MKKTILIGLMFFTLSGHSQTKKDTTIVGDTISYEKNITYSCCNKTKTITTILVLKDTTIKNTYVPLTPQQKKRNRRFMWGSIGAFVSLVLLGSLSK